MNPFKDQLRLVRTMMYPQFPTWTLILLIAFAIMRLMIILACTAILLMPLFKGAASRRKHLFLIRSVYPKEGKGMPYLVPNRCMIIAICELLSSILYVMTSYSNYEFDSNPEYPQGPKGYLITWYGTSFLPSYVGIWISVWSMVHACLSNVGGKTNSAARFITPSVYNSVWISWTLLVIGVTSYWAVRTTRIFISLGPVMIEVIDVLVKSAKSWNLHHSFANIPLGLLLQDRAILVELRDRATLSTFGWTGSWMAFEVVLLASYIITSRLLLRMLRQVLRLRESDTWLQQSQSPIWVELENEKRFLAFSSVALTLAISCQICVSVFQCLSGAHLTSPEWRIGSAIINHLPGVFMVPAQLIQSWRIFAERSILADPELNIPSLNFMHSDLPQTTSQLLGWDTTVFWGQEPLMETSNFSGLSELPLRARHSEDSSMSKDNSASEKSHMDIKVMRSTVVTGEAL
ncbi:hypothetical protein DFH28DRAFT_983524 [Melampsora americana]|nr:hypothetical protein DFH28DRAFT_983524 [Melampsora americana]